MECRARPLRIERDRWYVVLGLEDCSNTMSEVPHSSRQSFRTSRVAASNCQSPPSDRTRRSPSSTSPRSRGFSLPMRSVRNDLSTVMICETFTTDGFESPVPLVGRRMFPGASASRRFDVTTAATTVLIRLTLKLFAEMISSGRRKPGPDPDGSDNDAHQSSPRRITSYFAARDRCWSRADS